MARFLAGHLQRIGRGHLVLAVIHPLHRLRPDLPSMESILSMLSMLDIESMPLMDDIPAIAP
jgi:hypothetical protein